MCETRQWLSMHTRWSPMKNSMTIVADTSVSGYHKNSTRCTSTDQSNMSQTFSYSTHMSIEYVLVVNFKMPTKVGILKFMTTVLDKKKHFLNR